MAVFATIVHDMNRMCRHVIVCSTKPSLNTPLTTFLRKTQYAILFWQIWQIYYYSYKLMFQNKIHTFEKQTLNTTLWERSLLLSFGDSPSSVIAFGWSHSSFASPVKSKISKTKEEMKSGAIISLTWCFKICELLRNCYYIFISDFMSTFSLLIFNVLNIFFCIFVENKFY